MDTTIRRCTADDASALALVAQATMLETFAGVIDGADLVANTLEARNAASFARWLAEPEARLWLAELKGAPIGYAGLATPDLPLPTTHNDIELKRIYVLSRFQGGGPAGRLMDAAVDAAKAMGKARVLLGVKADNHRALAFYAKHGFAVIGTRRFLVGANYYDDAVLAKALA
ncbi:MAG TPA: GNAT family N-acetyltransferase [Caulobacterales bacterium]|nr:GNAT family N-acetyltransferase [Caulobacterales bacterium]